MGLTIMEKGESVSDTGWVDALVHIGNPRIMLKSVNVENHEVDFAESSYIALYPMAMEPGTGRQTDFDTHAGTLKHGFSLRKYDLNCIPNMELNGPLTVTAWVFHSIAARHKIRVIFEVLEP